MGWSCTQEQTESLNKLTNAIHAQPAYKLTPPAVGVLIELFEPRGRDFGYAPNLNIRVKIERITAGYRNEKLNAWQAETKPVGYVSIEPNGAFKFSSNKLKAELKLEAE
jgi:hypothetical protein